MEVKPIHRLNCHCGAVTLELKLPDGLVDPSRCSCSFCSKRGAVAGTAKMGNLKVVRGEEHLTLYQFNTNTAKHYFCSKCGIYTHHQRRSNPNEFGFNVACLEGVDVFELGEVNIHDGINHPSDAPQNDP